MDASTWGGAPGAGVPPRRPALVVGARRRRTAALLAALALAAGGVLGACRTVSALRVEPGQCLSLPAGATVTSVRVTPCTSPHDAQVVGTIPLGGTRMPSAREMDRRAEDGCRTRFEAFVGRPYEESSLDLTWWVPTAQSWARAEDRAISCLAVTADHSPVSRSFEHSGL